MPLDVLCRRMCTVGHEDTWVAAVRHIGELFGLQPNPDPFDPLGLPFPDLGVTIASIQTEPAANIWEHYSPPGASDAAAEALARARAKESRCVLDLGMSAGGSWLLFAHCVWLDDHHPSHPYHGVTHVRLRRGWQAEASELPVQPLPEPDLLQFRLCHFESLLLEGACLGAALWKAEQQLLHGCGYPLRPRRREEADAGTE